MLLSFNNKYPPFGSVNQNRSFSASSYRYGFNGQEKDDEVARAGNINTAMYWEYDTRLGRRWNLDPKSTIGLSDYACFADNPIYFNDVLGDVIGEGKLKVKDFQFDGNGKFKANFEFKGNVSKKRQEKLIANFYKKNSQAIEAMGKTPGGISDLKEIQSMPTLVSFQIKQHGGGGATGETKGKGEIDQNGTKYYESAKIVFYEKTILQRGYSDITEGVHAVGAHEKVHLMPGQIVLDHKKFAGLISEIEAERYTTYTHQLEAVKQYNDKYGEKSPAVKSNLETIIFNGVWPNTLKK